MHSQPLSESALESALASALHRSLDRSDGRCPENLAEAIRYSLLAPGKRIRPRLALACARMIGLALEAALPAALALEMIHCFTLIHDDLPCMDDDDVRRGRPSNHKVHGEALALLAGDALMMIALDTLGEAAAHCEPRSFARALGRFAWASGPRGVIGGQAAEAMLDGRSPLEALETMHAMKTGALFSAALLVPADLAGITQGPKFQAIDDFAAALGSAFQVADDLEDAPQGPRDPTHVLTYLSREQARSRTQDRLDRACLALSIAWGQEASAELLAIAAQVRKSLEGAR